MATSRMEALVVPRMLTWAREKAGMTITVVSKKFSSNVEKLKEWETGKSKPTLRQAEKLANIYKRPLAVFYLSKPPQEPNPPKDFRSLPDSRKEKFSPKGLLSIRRAQRIRGLFIELADSLDINIKPKITKIGLIDNPESIASQIRRKLNIDINTQFKLKDSYSALEFWKKTIESLGILVLEMSMPMDDGRALSLEGIELPTIVINRKDSPNGRIFSIFHEFAHILLNNTGICNMHERQDQLDEFSITEVFCNQFAGSFLVPREILESLIPKTMDLIDIDQLLKELARKFKVSELVILRRLLTLGYINNGFYKHKHEEINTELVNILKRKRGGRSYPERTCIRENGVPFVSLVFNAYKSDKITYSDISDYLNVKLKHFHKIERLLKEKSMNAF